jgi:hypothetical protein
MGVTIMIDLQNFNCTTDRHEKFMLNGVRLFMS